MPGGVVTSRLIIVAPIASVPLVNQTFALVDPSSTGDVLSVSLRKAGDSTNTVVAKWASWAMDDADRSEWNRAVGQALWKPRPTTAETTVYQPGGAFPLWGSQRMYLFDGLTWTDPRAILRAFGLEYLVSDDY
jgi:hypothetical protein